MNKSKATKRIYTDMQKYCRNNAVIMRIRRGPAGNGEASPHPNTEEPRRDP